MSDTPREFHWHFFANEELTSQLERFEHELRARTEQIVASDPERPPESSDVVYERDVRRALADVLRLPTPSVEDTYVVFLSYAREDEGYAVEVYSALQDADVRTFIDVRSIQLGDEWERVIQAAMARCRYCLSILTRAALTSGWCKKEIAMAHSERVELLPALRYVSVDEVESTFPELRGIQSTVLHTEDDKRRVVRFLEEKCSD